MKPLVMTHQFPYKGHSVIIELHDDIERYWSGSIDGMETRLKHKTKRDQIKGMKDLIDIEPRKLYRRMYAGSWKPEEALQAYLDSGSEIMDYAATKGKLAAIGIELSSTSGDPARFGQYRVSRTKRGHTQTIRPASSLREAIQIGLDIIRRGSW